MNTTKKDIVHKIVPPKQRSFFAGQKVLAHWLDGLHYLATICEVKPEKESCVMRFEDRSKFTVLYKHITQAAIYGSTNCCMCYIDRSAPPNEIAFCDSCSQGYHQLCHVPCINKSSLKGGIKWECRLCVFSSTAKLDALTWDRHHTVNAQNSYCYCGGPGLWFQKMLCCSRCEQWFHEACLECVGRPLYYADRFHMFVCALCNCGTEFTMRLPMKWFVYQQCTLSIIRSPEVMHGWMSSTLPCLTCKFSQNAVITTSTITSSPGSPSIENHSLLIPPRFINGIEQHRKAALFALRETLVPQPPQFMIPSYGPVTQARLQNMDASTCHCVSLTHSDKAVDIGQIYVMRHTLVNGKMTVCKRPRANAQLFPHNKDRKTGAVSKRSRMMSKQRVINQQRSKTIKPANVTSPYRNVEKISARQNLNSLMNKIPELLSFCNLHNPFHTKLEVREIKQCGRLSVDVLPPVTMIGCSVIDSPPPSSHTSSGVDGCIMRFNSKTGVYDFAEMAQKKDGENGGGCCVAKSEIHNRNDETRSSCYSVRKCIPNDCFCTPNDRQDNCMTNERHVNCIPYDRQDSTVPNDRQSSCLLNDSQDNCVLNKRQASCVLNDRQRSRYYVPNAENKMEWTHWDDNGSTFHTFFNASVKNTPSSSLGSSNYDDSENSWEKNDEKRFKDGSICANFNNNVSPMKFKNSCREIAALILSPPLSIVDESSPPPLIEPPSPPLSPKTHENPPKLEMEVTRCSLRKRSLRDANGSEAGMKFDGNVEFKNFILNRSNISPFVEQPTVEPVSVWLGNGLCSSTMKSGSFQKRKTYVKPRDYCAINVESHQRSHRVVSAQGYLTQERKTHKNQSLLKNHARLHLALDDCFGTRLRCRIIGHRSDAKNSHYLIQWVQEPA